MLFNSYEFIFLYLPLVAFVFFGVGHYSALLAAYWLAAASLFFYGWWNAEFVLLLLLSIVANYTFGYVLARLEDKKTSLVVLASAIALNISLLAYYKYANFFLSVAGGVFGWGFYLQNIVLPLGISFFTFTQIAYLVDVHRGLAREPRFGHYILFVTYFPHLVAGPILHHQQMMPQFSKPGIYVFRQNNLAIGLGIFTIGLAKKILLADGFGEYASPVFEAVGAGEKPSLLVAWTGALAYTFQIYFDFSGYSDMAIGLSRIFGVQIPLNFNSPYKAGNIIEFWRRWHMTLSSFLKEYLYFPLGGNRMGSARRYLNLMVTMLLGGLWHGAAWTFVVWGGLHGFYLAINHGWRRFCSRHAMEVLASTRMGRLIGVAITFLAVVVSWVFFRSADLDSAFRLLNGMTGAFGVVLHNELRPLVQAMCLEVTRYGNPYQGNAVLVDLGIKNLAAYLLVGSVLVWAMPPTHKIFPSVDEKNTRLTDFMESRYGWIAGLCFGCVFSLCLFMMSRTSEFLYFQF